MNPFKERKYRRLMFRAFPDLVKPTKRNYVSHEPTEAETNAGIGLMIFCWFGFMLLMLLPAFIK